MSHRSMINNLQFKRQAHPPGPRITLLHTFLSDMEDFPNILLLNSIDFRTVSMKIFTVRVVL